MPLYYFELQGVGTPPGENDGVLLDGPEQAMGEAVTMAGEMLKDSDGQFWNAPEWRLHVRDEQGGTVCVLTIRGLTGPD